VHSCCSSIECPVGHSRIANYELELLAAAFVNHTTRTICVTCYKVLAVPSLGVDFFVLGHRQKDADMPDTGAIEPAARQLTTNNV
jgi:hypothetical protein